MTSEGDSMMNAPDAMMDIKPEAPDFAVKWKRKSLSLKEKLDIIERIEKGEKKSHVAMISNIPRSTVNTIWATKDKWKSANIFRGVSDGCRRLREPSYGEIDHALYRWCQHARGRDESMHFPSALLIEKAQSFASSLGIERCGIGISWIERFRSRHGITYRPASESSAEQGADSMKNSWFVTTLPDLLADKQSSDIYVVSDIGLFSQVVPTENQIMGIESSFGPSQRVTLLIGANMDGSDRLSPLVVGNSDAVTLSLGNTEALSLAYRQNDHSWLTPQIWMDWLLLFDQRMYSMGRKVLLFMGPCPAHFIVGHLNLKSVVVHFIPVSCKDHMPIKLGVMQRLKTWYRKLVLRDMVNSVNDGVGFHVDTLGMLHYIGKAWDRISQTCVIDSFKLADWVPREYQDTDDMTMPSKPIPSITHECNKLNISVSIFQHINVEEERITTTEELTDDIILDSVTKPTLPAIPEIYLDTDGMITDRNVEQTGANSSNFHHRTSFPTVHVGSSQEDSFVGNGSNDVPSIGQAKAAMDTIRSFISAVESGNAHPWRIKAASSLKRKARKRINRRVTTKVMGLCPEKGVLEIQQVKGEEN